MDGCYESAFRSACHDHDTVVEPYRGAGIMGSQREGSATADRGRAIGVRLSGTNDHDCKSPGEPHLPSKTAATNADRCQIYTDWLYLWWIAYTSRMHGHIYIILKQSLKWVPILGPGMQFFSFIFMSRKWANDKPRMQYRLQKLASYRSGPVPGERAGAGKGQLNPMWLLIYPEGTNMSKNARATSKKWSVKTGLRDLDHALLPRSTGLKLCLDELGDSIEWVYDCTVAYEGIPRGEYGQDIFTLKATYFEGRPPPSVNMYWRRFPKSSIPLSSDEEFGDWLLARWREKDQLLEIFQQTGRFPASDSADATNGTVVGKKPHGKEWIETSVRPKSAAEVVQIFAPAAIIFLLANVATKFWKLLVYGSLKGAKKIPNQRVKATW